MFSLANERKPRYRYAYACDMGDGPAENYVTKCTSIDRLYDGPNQTPQVASLVCCATNLIGK